MTILKFSREVDWSTSTYVGRRNRMIPPGVPGSDGRFANPFAVEGTTKEARYNSIATFATWVQGDDPRAARLRAATGELVGRDLVCWCAPKRCHAEVLVVLAGGGGEDEITRLLEDMHDELVGRTLFDR